MAAKQYAVYILSNASHTLYVGVTNNLERRVAEHKSKRIPGFSAKYNLNRLVYYEVFGYVNDAIAREKQIKGWRRVKKVGLVCSVNPGWLDLSADWADNLP